MATDTLTGDAWIVDGRVRHNRLHDHFGSESDLAVALSERIGPYEEQTPIHWVLLDLVNRIGRLESTDIILAMLSGDAWISRNVLTGDAIIVGMSDAQLTGDAWIIVGRQLTGDAWIQAGRTLTGDAIIVY